MNKQLFLAFLATVVLGTGCKKSLEKSPEEINNTPIELEEIKGHIVSSIQAKKVAALFSIFPEPLKKGIAKNSNKGTYSAPTAIQKQKKEKSVKSIFSVKEGQVEPTVHVINYSEGGWAIVSGDDRMEPILAFSDTGKFVMTSIAELRPGVDIWMQANHRYISDLRSGKVQRKDSLGVKALWKDMMAKSEVTKGNYSVLTVPPLCNQFSLGETYGIRDEHGPWTVAKWGQGVNMKSPSYDWNSECPIYSCSPARTLVGCVAVSIAQLMYFHQYSSISFDFAQMHRDSATYESARLLKSVAVQVNTSFGCGSSSAGFTSTNNAFWHYGYSTANSGDFDYDDAVAELVSGYPIILTGSSGMMESGHQWIADGFLYMETRTCAEIPDDIPPPGGGGGVSKLPGIKTVAPGTHYGWVDTYSGSYFNMVWGSEGGEDGWYGAYVWGLLGHSYAYNQRMCIVRP